MDISDYFGVAVVASLVTVIGQLIGAQLQASRDKVLRVERREQDEAERVRSSQKFVLRDLQHKTSDLLDLATLIGIARSKGEPLTQMPRLREVTATIFTLSSQLEDEGFASQIDFWTALIVEQYAGNLPERLELVDYRRSYAAAAGGQALIVKHLGQLWRDQDRDEAAHRPVPAALNPETMTRTLFSFDPTATEEHIQEVVRVHGGSIPSDALMPPAG